MDDPRAWSTEELLRLRSLLVLGGGTAGTTVVNKMRPLFPKDEWSITVVEPRSEHHYQHGYLFIPSGVHSPDEVTKPESKFIPRGGKWLIAEVDRVIPRANQVVLTDGTTLGHDQLVIATGTTPRP
jgi:sulfide:quinone oxidoreductase